jgi:signal peptidase II
MGFLTTDSELERWLLVGLTAIIAGFVGTWLWREKKRDDVAALGLVLGGALGNILDRVRLGYVVDFADLHFGDIHPFLVFNVADAAITIGVLLLVLRALLTRERKPPQKDE